MYIFAFVGYLYIDGEMRLMLSVALGRKRSIAFCSGGLLYLELRDRSRIDIVEVSRSGGR